MKLEPEWEPVLSSRLRQKCRLHNTLRGYKRKLAKTGFINEDKMRYPKMGGGGICK